MEAAALGTQSPAVHVIYVCECMSGKTFHVKLMLVPVGFLGVDACTHNYVVCVCMVCDFNYLLGFELSWEV